MHREHRALTLAVALCVLFNVIPQTEAFTNPVTSFLHLIQGGTQKFTGPITSFVSFLKDVKKQHDDEPEDQANLLSEYDFIIVGAGTAGCTLANRLTEITGWKVLLVEAGGRELYLMDVPLLANYLQFSPANWGYKTEPSDKYCAGFDNQQCKWPRGKVVGGSSVLNYMIFTRGAAADYNNWEKMGNKGWGWDDVLPFFKKVENYNIPSFDDPEYHSHEGHVNVEYAPFRTSKGKAWVKGAEQLGFRYGDYNGAHPAGVSFLQLSMKNGTRHSSSRAYLHPIHERNNLHLTKNTLVTRLLFDDTNTKVIGVELEKNGRKQKIYARKEVIVSAGAINSPQLLMLSGIGPKGHLREMGIPVRKNLPVGYNLMDHIAAGGVQFKVNPSQGVSLSTGYILSHFNYVLDWMHKHSGPLSIPGGCEALVFLELKDKFNAAGWPDIELLFIGGGLNSDPLLPKSFNFDEQIYSETYGSMDKNDVFMVFPMLMRPKSRGRITLNSRDPKDHPKIVPNFFDDPEDLKTMVEGIKVAIEISKQPAMRKIGTKIYDVPIQDCLQYGPFGSDEYLACQAQMFTFTIYHQTGTCKMGAKGDPTAVVDPRLRVHGIKRLRVIDASIMPDITSCHPNAPTYMIAEKGASMIKEDWGRDK